jgi:hypothetical protein
MLTNRRLAQMIHWLALISHSSALMSRCTSRFSPQGRWIVYQSRAENGNGRRLEVIESKTGNGILHVNSTDNEFVIATSFSPDNSSIAILVRDRSADFSIRIFSLPNGKEQQRFPMAKREWIHLDKWEGHYFTALANVPDPSKPLGPRTVSFAINLESNPPGKETERIDLNTDAKNGENWFEIKSAKSWRAVVNYGGNVEPKIFSFRRKPVELFVCPDAHTDTHKP